MWIRDTGCYRFRPRTVPTVFSHPTLESALQANKNSHRPLTYLQTLKSISLTTSLDIKSEMRPNDAAAVRAMATPTGPVASMCAHLRVSARPSSWFVAPPLYGYGGRRSDNPLMSGDNNVGPKDHLLSAPLIETADMATMKPKAALG
jgi:hypothetical protein